MGEILELKICQPNKTTIRAKTKDNNRSIVNKRYNYNEPRFLITPCFSLHPDELFIYGKKDYISETPNRHTNSLQNLLNNQTHNKLSPTAVKKAKRAIKYLLVNSSEKAVYNPKFRSKFVFKVNFITLTLASPQVHSNQEIKAQLLNQFLIEAKKKWKLINYVWRAEKQKNGNIHFHILSDKFIPFNELRAVWNRIQNKLGYIDRFQATQHKKNPNSTDIHSLKNIKNVYKYVTKYMTKEKSKNIVRVLRTEILSELMRYRELSTERIEKGANYQSVSNGAKQYLGRLNSIGREWACSQSLSNITGARYEYDSEYMQEIEKLRKAEQTKEVVKNYVSMYYFQSTAINESDYPLLNSLLKSYIKLIFKEPDKQKIDLTGLTYTVPVYSEN